MNSTTAGKKGFLTEEERALRNLDVESTGNNTLYQKAACLRRAVRRLSLRRDGKQSVDDAYFRSEGGELVHAHAEDPAQHWSKLKEQRLKETVLDEIHLPCSLNEFSEMFVTDDCPHSFGMFQTSACGDFEIEVDKWEKDHGAAEQQETYHHVSSSTQT
jgi:hypothetical protein